MRYSRLVSICMPVFNRSALVMSALNSLLAQSYPNIEILIIDDGSTDETPDLIASVKDSRVRLLRQEKNQGNYVCRNIAIEASSGDYIAIMDSDDISHRDRILQQVDALDKGYMLCGT